MAYVTYTILYILYIYTVYIFVYLCILFCLYEGYFAMRKTRPTSTTYLDWLNPSIRRGYSPYTRELLLLLPLLPLLPLSWRQQRQRSWRRQRFTLALIIHIVVLRMRHLCMSCVYKCICEHVGASFTFNTLAHVLISVLALLLCFAWFDLVPPFLLLFFFCVLCFCFLLLLLLLLLLLWMLLLILLR